MLRHSQVIEYNYTELQGARWWCISHSAHLVPSASYVWPGSFIFILTHPLSYCLSVGTSMTDVHMNELTSQSSIKFCHSGNQDQEGWFVCACNSCFRSCYSQVERVVIIHHILTLLWTQEISRFQILPYMWIITSMWRYKWASSTET
jgi:hypothetical protein